jgi:hypothetical protein
MSETMPGSAPEPFMEEPFGANDEFLTEIDMGTREKSVYPTLTDRNDRTGDRD